MKKIIFKLAFLSLVLFAACSSSDDVPEMEHVIVVTQWENNDAINGYPTKTRVVFMSPVKMLVAVDEGKGGIGAFGVYNVEFYKYTRDKNRIFVTINGKDVTGYIQDNIITFSYQENGNTKKIIFTKIKKGSS